MKKITFILLFLFSSGITFAQSTLKNSNDLRGYHAVPQEKIYVHHNASLFFTGEYLYYSIYSINTETNQLSDLSKIAYIELISKGKTAVYRQKIRLENGLGQGDFFIPTSIPSGNYKLICYTNWMKNGGKSHYYRDDISIINPFQGNQKALLTSDELIDSLPKNKVKFEAKKAMNNALSIGLDKVQFKHRAPLSFRIKNKNNTFQNGTYSLSVRKIDTIEAPVPLSATRYTSLYSKNPKSNSKAIEQTIHLPELRGELYSGLVTNKENGSPIANKRVAVSIPGEAYVLKVANTNEKGIFYFNLAEEYSGEKAIIQVLGADRANYNVSLNEHQSVDYGALTFSDFKIAPSYKKLILDRSIQHQIENGYFSVKPDSILPTTPLVPFFNSRATAYNLNDYTRFSTVRETILEIIDHVSVRKEGKNKFVFHVRGYDPYIESDFHPLVLIDGLLIQDHNELVDYSAKKIKTMYVVRDKYLYGAQIFDGVIAMETIDGDYQSTRYGDYITQVTFFKPITNKKYFHQVYDDEKVNLNRIPDYRNQLLWEPRVTFDAPEKVFTCYTSDNAGRYEIVLEGFTAQGNPVSIKEVITVE
jgi:hypothetical protein